MSEIFSQFGIFTETLSNTELPNFIVYYAEKQDGSYRMVKLEKFTNSNEANDYREEARSTVKYVAEIDPLTYAMNISNKTIFDGIAHHLSSGEVANLLSPIYDWEIL